MVNPETQLTLGTRYNAKKNKQAKTKLRIFKREKPTHTEITPKHQEVTGAREG